ncbi:hypothetical protein FOL47_002547, partial [Perkinsus chesapeaki]
LTASNLHRQAWQRGESLVDWCLDKGVRILNDDESLPTFESERDGASPRWELVDDLCGSDHRLLYVEVDSQGGSLAPPRLAHRLVDTAKGITDSLSTLVREFTPEAPAPSDTTWWTSDLSRRKAKLKRAQRTFYRHKKQNGPDAPSTVHFREIRDTARRKFCAAVKEAKGVAARRFFNDLQHYSRCVKRGCPRIPPAAICPEGVNQADFLLRRLFPRDPDRAAEVDALVLSPQTDPVPAVTHSELREAANGLRRGAAPGEDDVTNGIILDTLEVLKDNWSTQFTKALGTGEYPGGWKTSKGIFIHKAGRDPTKPNGWRPICLVGSGSKLFERLIVERLASCPQIRKRLDSPIVHGFCKGKSVDSAVLRVVEAFRAGRKRSKRAPIALVQLDVQNAFSSVKHSHILATLVRYNVPRYLVRIVEDYLKAQYVSAIYGSDEAGLELERGVPQGSALGPFLFLLSTLPLVDEFADMEGKGVSLTLYADDTTVVVSGGTGPSLVKRWRSAEALLLAWATNAGVSYEPVKSQALLPRTIGDHILSLDGTPIDIVKVVRVLGVWIDHRLSFQHHIRLKVSEAKAKLGRLRHLGWARAGITGKKIIKTYKVAILPALAHAIVAWKEGLESATAKTA